jgi:hypothetical protein
VVSEPAGDSTCLEITLAQSADQLLVKRQRDLEHDERDDRQLQAG